MLEGAAAPFEYNPQRRHARRERAAASRFLYHFSAVRAAHRKMMFS